METLRTKVLISAVTSRICVLVWGFIADLFIPNHSSDGFQWVTGPTKDDPQKILDPLISFFLDGFTRWDGQHFLHVAEHGYTYENSLAFFPLYPGVVSLVGRFLYWCQVDYGLASYYSCLKLAAVAVNMACFVLAASVLYDLSRKVLKDEYLAYKSALYFCVNPASVFFTAAYSESIYSLVSFYTMLKIERAFKLQMSMLLSLASAVRSNGVINVGFAVYKALKIVVREIATHKRLGKVAETSTTVANVIGDAFIPGIICVIIGTAPYAFCQWYAFMHFCRLTKFDLNVTDSRIIDYGLQNGYKLPSDPIQSPWCLDQIPNAYGYVQTHYWDVGFLRYYKLQNLPNFIIAAPIFVLVLHQCWAFLRFHAAYVKTLGLTLLPSSSETNSFDRLYKSRVLPKECFVYVAHCLCLTVFCALFVNLPTTTRLLCSACPVIYWFAALYTTPVTQHHVPLLKGNQQSIETRINLESYYRSLITDEIPRDRYGEWLRLYFISYAIFGTIFFVNWLPWT